LTVADQIGQHLAAAVERQFGVVLAEPTVRRSAHADFQWNDPMALAKQVGAPPREVAERVIADAGLDDIAALEVAGPGFVNITVHDAVLSAQVHDLLADARLGTPAVDPERIVVDYSAPNVAKQLHVGHLRSTVIGDALMRILRFAGHEVIPQNHIGDWGTQFGILIAHLLDTGLDADGIEELDLAALTGLYRDAQGRFEADADFTRRARDRVVLLQSGDDETLGLWQSLVAKSEQEFVGLYGALDVLLDASATRGESSYNDLLQPTLDELVEKGIVVEDDGALCAFPDGFTGRDDRPLPLIVRKADGGFGYAATDLAALRFRRRELGADRILYVVDVRQSQHFAMVFAVARAAGWIDDAEAEHIGFGTILGADGKPFRTREGGLISLRALIDEAIDRAATLSAERAEIAVDAVDPALARALGIGALKYGDLSNDRIKDYVFDWDRMVTLVGNTAPYLQYTHARLMSIRAKAGDEWAAAHEAAILLGDPVERELVLQLLSFGEAVRLAVAFRQPHRICTHLFDLAAVYSRMYEQCPVLKAPTPELRRSRLALCRATAEMLRCGLDLLGIAAPERI